MHSLSGDIFGAFNPHIGNHSISAEDYIKTLSDNDAVDFQVMTPDFENNWRKMKQTSWKEALRKSHKAVLCEIWYLILPYLARILGIGFICLAFTAISLDNLIARIGLTLIGGYCLFLLPMQLPVMFDFGSIEQINDSKKYYQELRRFRNANSFKDALMYLEDSYSSYYRQTGPGLEFYTAFVSLGYLHKISNDYEVEKSYYLEDGNTLVLGIKRRGDETAPMHVVKLSCKKRLDPNIDQNKLRWEKDSDYCYLMFLKKI